MSGGHLYCQRMASHRLVVHLPMRDVILIAISMYLAVLIRKLSTRQPRQKTPVILGNLRNEKREKGGERKETKRWKGGGKKEIERGGRKNKVIREREGRKKQSDRERREKEQSDREKVEGERTK